MIYKVQEEDEDAFKENYGKEILKEADSMMQAFLKFEQEIMYSLDYMPGSISWVFILTVLAISPS